MNPRGTRVQKAIAQAGIASRRHAEELILAGQVRVNGQVVRQLGVCLRAGQDTLEVDGRPLQWERPANRQVWALYKPKGCVSTMSDPQGRPTLREFFPRSNARLFSVGRLDFDAEGLILLTNDGELANQIAHPSHSVPKTYLVKVKGLVSPETLRKLGGGAVVDGRRRRPARAKILHHLADKTWVEVILREGVYHHIKKMFATLGHRVLKIKRYSIGAIALEGMTPGEARRLAPAEVEGLLARVRPLGGKNGRAAPPAGEGASAPPPRSRASGSPNR